MWTSPLRVLDSPATGYCATTWPAGPAAVARVTLTESSARPANQRVWKSGSPSNSGVTVATFAVETRRAASARALSKGMRWLGTVIDPRRRGDAQTRRGSEDAARTPSWSTRRCVTASHVEVAWPAGHPRWIRPRARHDGPDYHRTHSPARPPHCDRAGLTWKAADSRSGRRSIHVPGTSVGRRTRPSLTAPSNTATNPRLLTLTSRCDHERSRRTPGFPQA